ncbi:hypothetical protein [Kitasatospora sp. NPDC015120]|uniref:hypothetical protein n=1 Tax=Kitasatospora sp. NPDC015120 TaxID=3364023 RepID=UPI0036F49CE3
MFHLGAFLTLFVDSLGDSSIPTQATEPRPAGGFLSVAGRDLPATTLSGGGCFALTATDGDETFAVAGLIGLEDLARELVFETA